MRAIKQSGKNVNICLKKEKCEYTRHAPLGHSLPCPA